MDKEIRALLKGVILKQLETKNGVQPTQEEYANAVSRLKLLIGAWNDADKNDVEREKVTNEKEKHIIEREKIKAEIEMNEQKISVEREKIAVEREKIKAEIEMNEQKISVERERIAADNDKARWDFYGRLATSMTALAGTIVSIIFLNRWTKWGFIQEEFGSITSKTMGNVMREWRLKRS